MSRDNFSKKDIVALRTRVGDRCSNPDCRKTTVGPANTIDKATILGDAAHICAASRGGPRYDPKMTSAERKSITNGIWLCKSCARLIDVDYTSYDTELLHEWKRLAEEKAKEELNQPLFNQNEVNNMVINSTISMINGIPTTEIFNLVQNAIHAEVKTLEAKDPRFSVVPKYTEQGISYQLCPKEDISINMILPREYISKHREFIEHGKDIILSTDSISVSGSDLIQSLCNQAERINIIGPKRQAILRFRIIDNMTNIVEFFNDINGNISFGTKSFTFSGKGFGDILKVSMQIFKNNISKISMSIVLDKWENISLLELPYFVKLWRFFTKIESGSRLYTDLEIDGDSVISNLELNINQNDKFEILYALLQYTNHARNICERLNQKIFFTKHISFTSEEHQEIAQVEMLLREPIRNTDSPVEPAKSKIIITPNNVPFLNGPFKKTDVRFVQTTGDEISLFKNIITLPPRIITLNSVIPKLLSNNADSIRFGDEVELLFEPTEGYEYLIEYKQE